MQKNVQLTDSYIEFCNYGIESIFIDCLYEYVDILSDELLEELSEFSNDPYCWSDINDSKLQKKIIDFIINYYKEGITYVADELAEYNVEDNYATYYMVFKHNDKYYGVPYTEDRYDATEILGKYTYIEDCPEFEPYTRTSYRIKEK